MKSIIIIDDDIEINLTIKNEFTFNYVKKNIISILSDKENLKEKKLENNKKMLEKIKKKKVYLNDLNDKEETLSEEDKNNFIDYIKRFTSN